MKSHIRKQSWAIAALSLIGFCWLGVAALGFRPLFQGLEINLPIATRFAIACGPIAFPVFGIIAALVVILLDLWGRRRRIQLFLTICSPFLLFRWPKCYLWEEALWGMPFGHRVASTTSRSIVKHRKLKNPDGRWAGRM